MHFKVWLVSAVVVLGLAACNKASTTTSATEDSSASGAAGSAAAGALSASSSSGTQASLMIKSPEILFSALKQTFLPNAWASNACPTFKTASGSGCTASGATLWLDYSDCSFGSSEATWSGVQAITKNSGSATCGTFPAPAASGSLIRQYVTAVSGTTPGTATQTTSFGTVTTIDNATAKLGNFAGDAVSYITVGTSGYGTQINFNASSLRSSMVIAERIYATGKFDHSVTGTVDVSETSGSTSQTLTGSVKVYHNLLKVVGTSTFNSVIHENSCCQPTGGSISTVFAAGTSGTPTLVGATYIGKTETLTFTGCGTGTLTATDGTTTDVTVSRCF